MTNEAQTTETLTTAPGTEIPFGTRAVVISFTGTKARVTFDLLREPYGVTLSQLTSNAINAMIQSGREFSGYAVHFVN